MARLKKSRNPERPWYERMADGKPANSHEAFNAFFQGEFQRRLDRVGQRFPELAEASWDRKAAFLLWKAEKHDKEA